MGRFAVLLVALAASLLWIAPARASGDVGCTSEWRLYHDTLSGCDNMALLGPGNDTRINLALLLLDKRAGKLPPAKASGEEATLFDWRELAARVWKPLPQYGDPDYIDGEGSRCRSNVRGIAAFEAAIGAAQGVPANERAALLEARKAIDPSCTNANDGTRAANAAASVRSPAGKEFARYLMGALAFYDGNFDQARRQFDSLAASPQPWLRETAFYMVARTEVNGMQAGAFDEYGFLQRERRADPKVRGAAQAALEAYLQQFPKGQYAGSAWGLIRRVQWLGGETARLGNIYANMLSAGPAQNGIDDRMLIDEIDIKLLDGADPSRLTDPLLIAVADLQRMRKAPNYLGDTEVPQLTRAQLEAQRPRFASEPALFEFLLAAHAFYVGNQPREVLKLIPDAARQQRFTYLQFSRQMLRGMALERIGDSNTRGFWLEAIGGASAPFQRPAAELALAYHLERAGTADRVFLPDSPVRNRAIREILLMHIAGPALLRQQAKDRAASRHERDLALFVLLYKQATRGAYAAFVSDLALVPVDASRDMPWSLRDAEKVGVGVFARGDLGIYDCPALRQTASLLAQDPKASKPLLCLTDFMRANNFDGYELDNPPEEWLLGGGKSQFPGGNFSRLEIYKGIIANPAAPGADKAYALFRAINCYATSGNNSCGGVEVPIETRKAWFNRLKKEFPTSRWAKELKYYW